MPARIRTITVDCHDPARLARFWAEVLGYIEDPTDPNQPGDTEHLVIDPAGHRAGLLFIAVPEPKGTKNRIHLDLQPSEGMAVEVERVLALGGTVLDDRRTPEGAGWVVMADPEGNELCVLRSAAERPEEAAPVDSGERDMPAVRATDERSMLCAMLDWYREGVVEKVAGLRAHHVRARPVRSATSVAGLLKHLALVEDHWFSIDFAGLPVPPPWQGIDWDADPDWEFHSALEDDLDDLVALYQQACARSREVTEAHALDDVGVRTDRGPFTLRWVLVHLLEETARHLGQLDILREHLDGATGD